MDDVVKFFFVMATLMIVGLGGYAGFTAIRAFERKSKRAVADLDPNELEAIRADLADVDQLRARVAELEERADFTDRLLAQHNDAARIERKGA